MADLFTDDLFTGDGATNAFSLSSDPGDPSNVLCAVNGALQVPTLDYSVSGTTLSFATAPVAGAVIFARHTASLQASNTDFTPVGSGAVARDVQARLAEGVSLLDFIPVSEHAAILAGTSTYDCLAAMDAAIDSVTTNVSTNNAGGPRVYCPPGIYRFSDRIQLKKTVIIEGAGAGQAGASATVFAFDADKDGVVVHRYNTIDSTTESPTTTGGDASILRNLELRGVNGSTSGDGIWLRARASIEQVRIVYFGRYGIRVEATAGGSASREGNANNFSIQNVRISNCGSDGLFIDGADVNAGLILKLDSSSNGGWGVNDSSFLGNTYIGCHTAANTAGSYKTDNQNARNVFIGCYSEGGQGSGASIVTPTVVLGGLFGTVASGSTAFVINGGTSVGDVGAFSVASNASSALAFTTSVSRVADEALTVIASGDHSAGLQLLTWNNTDGTWVTRHARLGARTSTQYTTNLSTGVVCGRSAAIGAGNVVFGRGIWIGPSLANARFQSNDGSVPTTGTYARGDVLWRRSPSAGQSAGWICVSAGTPGTWVPFGNTVLQASATWDPPSVAAAGTASTTITATGAALGDFVQVSFSVSLAGLIAQAYVSATNTVTVTLYNPTTAAVDLASSTVRVQVTKA